MVFCYSNPKRLSQKWISGKKMKGEVEKNMVIHERQHRRHGKFSGQGGGLNGQLVNDVNEFLKYDN